ncbi:MAG: GIY-YIG nuclease family protein, partial [Alphaproteobacteria bacterium]|nr:GIY-YIG nuclease family protein [Alphaproteobacteria bacterium]
MSKTPSPNANLIKHGRTGFEKGAEILRFHLKTIPDKPGVYRMISEKSVVLYVGKAKNLRKRVSSYTQRTRLPHRLQRMVAQIRSVEVTVTRTEAEALLLEANFIQKLTPPFNVLLRDDKSYPYILIRRDHAFPQMLKHRGNKTAKGWYFGPFASAGAVAETLELMQRAFMLRNCSDSLFVNRTRPCLQYHIKRCTAPCVGKVTRENYGKQVTDACNFLKGRNQEIQQKLAADMQKASDALDFENAAKLRDR